jgi:ribosomal protein S18 acetylase RimI-like enzyme
MPDIVPAQLSDGQAILSLTSRTTVFNAGEKDCVKELWDAYASKGQASGYSFLVYRDSGQVLGYACYGSHSLTRSAFDLHWIAVEPGMQGRGIGRALISRVEAEVKAAGGTLLLVETSGTAHYLPTRRFYEGCGYERQAVIRDFYDAGDDLVIFARYF